ncbi:MAG: translation initiation factor [Cryomorphaceae bacterium]|nr:translation initiation factor [Cryomorphaceae bacterium]
MAKKSKKHSAKGENGGIVYSTSPGWNPFAALEDLVSPEEDSVEGESLVMRYEKKGRSGKPVTVVEGWRNNQLPKETERQIKQHCGVGGSFKDGILILQGNQRQAFKLFSKDRKWKVKG